MLRLLPAVLRPSAASALPRVSLLTRTTPSMLELSMQVRGAKTKAGDAPPSAAKVPKATKAAPKAAASGETVAEKAKAKAAKPEKKAEKSAEPAKAAKPSKPASEKAAKPAKSESVAASKSTETPKEDAQKDTPKERTLSPFAAFMQRNSADNKKSTSPLAFVDLTKTLSQKWKSLSEEQKKAYEGVKVVAKRRRQPSAFDAYKSERLKQGTPSPMAFKQASEDWKKMSEQEKSKYQLIASPKGLVPKSTKRTAWQMYLSQYLMKLDQSQRSKGTFKDNLQKAAAEFKKLGEADKKKLTAQN